MPNYTAYAARAFFDNGGQQLYVARIANDVQQAGPASARPATASLAVPSSGTVLLNLLARFPGSGGNVNVVFTPRPSKQLLQLRTPAASDTVVLRLSNVPATALVDSALPASAFPLKSLIATASPTPTAASGQYTFIANQRLLYVDSSDASVAALPTAFASAIQASAVTAGTAQAVTFQAPTDAGAAPLYAIPVGTNIRTLFNLQARTLKLYGTVSGGTVTLPRSINPDLGTDTTVPLAALGMGSRGGDGNIIHESYDITAQINGLTTFSFPDVDLEQDADNSLADALTATPSTGNARATQPIQAAYNGTVGVAALWAALLASFDQALLFPTNPAAAPSFVLHLTGGNDGAAPQSVDYAGEVDERNGSYGLAALESIDQVSIVLCPAAVTDPAVHHAVVSAMQAHCTKMLYRVGVIDPPRGSAVADVQQFAGQFSDTRLAIYYPWVEAASLEPGSNDTLLLPPSGFVGGLYAYTDITRGVHKAPANEVVQEALDLEVSINSAQQGRAEPARHQLHPLVPGARHPGVGRADVVAGPAMAVRERPPLFPLSRTLDLRVDELGRVRAERSGPVGQHHHLGERLSVQRMDQRQTGGKQAGGRVFRALRPHHDDAGRSR